MILIDKIESFVKENGLPLLVIETGIRKPVLVRLLARDKSNKYNKSTLDTLYGFFKLDVDDFYRDNMKKRYPKTACTFGNLIRNKRIQLGIDLDRLSRITRVDKRALCRLEAGDALPTFNSFTIQEVIKALAFSEKEIEIMKVYIKTQKDLEDLVKKISPDEIEKNLHKIRIKGWDVDQDEDQEDDDSIEE